MIKENDKKIQCKKLSRWDLYKMLLTNLFSSKPHLIFKFKKNGQLKIIWFNAHCWLMLILTLLFLGLGLFSFGITIMLCLESFTNPLSVSKSFWQPLFPGLISFCIGCIVCKKLHEYLNAQVVQINSIAENPERCKELMQGMTKMAEFEQKDVLKNNVDKLDKDDNHE